jgi:hypothetical protein
MCGIAKPNSQWLSRSNQTRSLLHLPEHGAAFFGQAVLLQAAGGFVGDCHFYKSLCYSRLLVTFPEVLLVC